jgi:hypothetical protein
MIFILCFSLGLPFASTSKASNFDIVSSEPRTLPSMVFFPSRCGAGAKQIKNWLPLLIGPLLAMLTIPRALWRSDGRISSSNGSCQMEVDVLVFPEAGEPVWNIKPGTSRWMGELS